MIPKKFFSERVKLLRKQKNMTQVALGKQAGFHQTAIKNFELGQQTTTFDGLVRIADALDVSADYLLGRTDDPTPPKPPKPSNETNGEAEVEQAIKNFLAMVSQ